jgi:uncharacterized protein (TIGR02118 family)
MPVLTLHYSASGEGEFDDDYYVKRHVPMVERIWGPYLARLDVLKGVASLAPNTPVAFSAIVVLHFLSDAALQEALQHPDSALLQQDVANFSAVAPLAQLNLALTA